MLYLMYVIMLWNVYILYPTRFCSWVSFDFVSGLVISVYNVVIVLIMAILQRLQQDVTEHGSGDVRFEVPPE